MKKWIAIILLSPLTLVAQPTLNAFNPVYGDSQYAHKFSYKVDLNFSTSGNQNWDFSCFAKAPAKFTFTMIDPTTAPHANEFPTANIAQSLAMNGNVMAFLYGRITADSLWSMAIRYPSFPSMDEEYVDPNISFGIPWNLNGVMDDVSESSDDSREISQHKYEGWVNIVTPHGTFNNVVLISEKKMVNGVLTLEDY